MPPNLAGLWASKFLLETAQETAWEAAAGEQLAAEFRATITGLAPELPEVEGEVMRDRIKWWTPPLISRGILGIVPSGFPLPGRACLGDECLLEEPAEDEAIEVEVHYVSPRFAPARSFITPDQSEKASHGLYRYLLFGSRPTAANRDRYVKAIRAYMNIIARLEQSESLRSPEQLNVTFLPLSSLPDRAVDISADKLLDDYYDFVEARRLLDRLPHRLLLRGPYIVSLREPLSTVSVASGDYLLQNLSRVPPYLVEWWVELFLEQASRERFWEQNFVTAFIRDLRTSVAVLAEGVPELRRSLNVIVLGGSLP